MKRFFLRPILLAAALWLALAQTATAKPIVVKVLLNKVDKGVYVVHRSDNGDMLLWREDLESLDIVPNLIPWDEDPVSLRSLKTVKDFQLNEQAATLDVNLDPEAFGVNEYRLGEDASKYVYASREPVAYLDYHLSASEQEGDLNDTLLARFDGVANFGEWVARTDHAFNHKGDAATWTRRATNFTLDDPSGPERLVLGDILATGGRLGGAANLAGVSLGKAYFMKPYFRPYPSMEFKGSTGTPSRVDVFLNGQLIETRELPPGIFVLSDFFPNVGSGDVKVVVTDYYGNTEEFFSPFYLSNLVLKEGLHDYSYNLGWMRSDIESSDFRYDKPVFLGSHRYGLTENMTLGYGAELAWDHLNVSPEVNMMLGIAGELSIGAALSLDVGKTGHGFLCDYRFVGRYLTATTGYRYRSENYSTVNVEAGEELLAHELLYGVSAPFGRFGSFSLSGRYADWRSAPTETSLRATYDVPTFRSSSLVFEVERRWSDEDTSRYFVGIRGSLGREAFASLDHDNDDGRTVQQLSVKRNPLSDMGTWLEANVRREEDDEGDLDNNGRLQAQYRGTKGILTAQYEKAVSSDRYSVTADGAVAYHDGDLYLSRPIRDSFAIVKAGDAEGVRVNRNHLETGSTGEGGKVIVPGLVSYSRNALSIEQNDLPVDYSIDEELNYVVPRYRSGVLVDFNAERLRAVTGKLHFLHKGEKVDAKYAKLVVTRLDHKSIISYLGRDGFFYLENLTPGRYTVHLRKQNHRCSAALDVPAGESIITNLGDMGCETL